jgi:hypothetical protein
LFTDYSVMQEGKKLTMASDEGSRVVLAELDDNADC